MSKRPVVVVGSLEVLRPGSAIEAHLRGLHQALVTTSLADFILCAPSSEDPRNPLSRLVSQNVTLVRKVLACDVFYMRWHPFGFIPVAVAALIGRKIVLEINGTTDDVILAHPRVSWLSRFVDGLTRFQFRRADALVAVTSGLGRWAKELARREIPIEVVPNGAPKSLGMVVRDPQSPPYAIFFGELAEWQGIETLLGAAESGDWPRNLKLVIVGDGRLRREVEAAAQRRPEILQYLGRLPREDAERWVSGAMMSISPQSCLLPRARWGVSPIKVAESLMMGVPVVISRTVEFHERIAAAGFGVVHEPDTEEDLTAAVNRAVHLFGGLNRDDVSDWASGSMSWESAAEKTLRLLFSEHDLPRHVSKRS